MLTLPSCGSDGATFPRRARSPGRVSPRSSCASADKHNATARQGLHGGSAAAAEVASVAICSGPAAHQRRAAWPARSRTMPCRRRGWSSNEAVSRKAAHRCASAVCPVSTAIHPARTASGGYSSTAGTAEGREPPLHGRQLAGLVGRQDQLRHQLDAPVPFGRVQQVFEGQRRGPVGLVPVGGSQVQLRDDLGLDAAKLAEQELPEQGVVAIPPAPAVQRDQEQARRLQVAKLRLRARLVEDRVAQRSTQLVEHRRAPQEPLNTFRQLHQRLAVQVVGHVPIVTGDRQHVAVAVAWRSARRGRGRPAILRSGRSPRRPARA